MQPNTPQPNPPAPVAPPTPPTAPTPNAPEGDQGGFYQSPQSATPYAAPTTAERANKYAAPAANATDPPSISWEASEYVHTDKGGLWLFGFGVIVAVFIGVAVYLQAWTFLALVVVMAIAMGFFAFRQPHTLHYTLNDNGIHIGDKTFNYSDFRAFGVMQDGAFFTMTFIPIKRFAPALNVYFAEEQGEQIVDIVGAHLPMERIEPDIIDYIMRRLHF